MDNRTFQRYDKFMGAYGQWIRDGKSVPGLYAVQEWPQGRPCASVRRLNRKVVPYPREAWERARNRLTRDLMTQPHSTRERPTSKILLYNLDNQLEQAHRNIVRFDADLKRFILVAWVRGRVEIRDIAVILDMSSRQIRNEKRKVFDKLGVLL